jgi:hypothetical protein
MKQCTYCGKEYPDEASVCAIDGEPLRDVTPQLPIPPALPTVTPQNIARGTLSLGSFIKLSVIAAIGCLPVVGVLFALAFLVGLVRGHHHTTSPDDFPMLILMPLLLLKVVLSAMSIVISGFFSGLCSYPFYAWLCRRRGGIVLNGRFELL